MKENLFNLIRKHHFNISIYTAEIFERRCQEEIIRSDEDKSSFVYIEFDFSSIQAHFRDNDASELFFKVLLATLDKNCRGSDVIGFLEKDGGLGLLLLDSKIDGWQRIKGRIIQTAENSDIDINDAMLESIVKPIVYPACIQSQD